MDVETHKTGKGVEIRIRTSKKVALVVKTSKEERIYLPDTSGNDKTYYVENTAGLQKTAEGYAVLHQGDLQDLKVLS